MEKVYKSMKSAGAAGVAIGIVTLVVGISVGIISIIAGAKLLRDKSYITF